MCPDTMISGGGGSQDITDVKGSVDSGVRCIEYRRMLNTGVLIASYVARMTLFILRSYMYIGDLSDRPYFVNNQTQFLAWALGPRATEEGLRDLAFYHTEIPRNGGSLMFPVLF